MAATSPVTPALQSALDKLRDPRKSLRIRAALDLGTLADPAAVEDLVAVLCADPDFFVRETVIWSLVRFGEAAVTPLISRLRDPSACARMSAAHALGKIGNPRAVDPLIAVLTDSDLEVVARAAYALGQIGDARAGPALVRVLGHDDRELESTLVGVLERFSRSVIEPLIGALAHENWRTREQAADVLRVIGAQSAAPALARLLEDSCWRVRFAAISALWRLGDAGLNRIPAKPDGDPRVRALQSRIASSTRPG
jgi:HEAT repeat protein